MIVGVRRGCCAGHNLKKIKSVFIPNAAKHMVVRNLSPRNRSPLPNFGYLFNENCLENVYLGHSAPFLMISIPSEVMTLAAALPPDRPVVNV